MAKIDLTKMSYDELKKLREDVDKALAEAEKRRRKDALEAMKKVAAQYGLTPEELLQKDQPEKKVTKRRKPSVSYKDPSNPENTWAGIGRKPRWLEEALGSGRNLEEFRIEKSA